MYFENEYELDDQSTRSLVKYALGSGGFSYGFEHESSYYGGQSCLRKYGHLDDSTKRKNILKSLMDNILANLDGVTKGKVCIYKDSVFAGTDCDSQTEENIYFFFHYEGEKRQIFISGYSGDVILGYAKQKQRNSDYISIVEAE